MKLTVESEDLGAINLLIKYDSERFSYNSVMSLAASIGSQSIVDQMLLL